MSEQLAVQAEIEKLSRLFDVPTDELSYATALPSATIHALGQAVSDTLFDAGRDKLQRIAAASKLVPSAMTAAFAQRYFGPLLCARVAVLVEPDRAADLARRLPTRFLADVSLHLDPRRAANIIAKIGDDQVVEVARDLIARAEFITMGRFVGYVSLPAILRAIDATTPAELLRIAFFVEETDRFDAVVDALPDGRIGDLISAAAGDALWAEALTLIDAISAPQRERVANIAARQNDEVLTSMARTAHERDLYDVVLPLVTLMDIGNRQRLAALPALHEPEMLGAIVATTARHDLWGDLLPLADMLPADAVGRVAAAAAELPEDILIRVIHAAHEHQQRTPLITIAERMDDQTRSELIGLLDSFDDNVIATFVDAATVSADLIERAIVLLDTAQEAHLEPVLKRVARLAPGRRAEFVERARSLGVLDCLGALGEALLS